ncbi:MAG: flavin reductase family protein [Fimbriimonadaceae bacterium]|nr:flavin reductase family protein [Fimbriimonadaceae bacterium]
MFKQVPAAEALAGKYPEWLVFVTAANPDGPPNFMPAGWCMVCSSEPPMLAVALGHGRHTAALVQRTGEFAINFCGEGQHDLITRSGTVSGRDVNKLEVLRVATAPGKLGFAPLISGCARAFECKLRHVYPSGDHNIFVGEVVAAHIAEPAVSNLVNFGGWYSAATPATPRS